MHELQSVLQETPEIALFLALACGHAFGRIRFGPIQLGGVCGTLLAALAIGSLVTITPAASIKNFFFALFIFSLGYAGGPQFFANLNAKGLRLGCFCLIEVAIVIALVLAATRLFGLDQGSAAGLMAGAATESAVVGTATDAISGLPLSPEAIKNLQANVVTAYSITYVFGLITIVIATSQLFPLMFRIDLRSEAAALWKTMSGASAEVDATALRALPDIVGRIYVVEHAAGVSIAELELRGEGLRVNVERIKRRGKLIDATDDMRLEAGDYVLLTGMREGVQRCGESIGAERDHVSGLDFAVDTRDVILNRRDLHDVTLDSVRRRAQREGIAQGVYIVSVTRSGVALPMLAGLRLQTGDLVRLQGLPSEINDVATRLGKIVKDSDETDVLFAGIGIVLGIFIGQFGVKLGGVTFSLGTGGGALLSGLVFGWLQNAHPAVGNIPASAIELMKDLGLSMFIACVGLSSGPQAFALIKSYGIALPLTGILIALLPAACSLVFGRYVLKLESPILLGAIAGQQCSTPALSAVVSAAGNTTPLLGYTITYAISNVVLPLMGPLIVFLAGQVAPQ
ncbi:aspartate-alanine antiporter [Uliginosibacterium sp. sgz301328]|uniref:aspartate-alanine antiporter n=1 Tax=Uliginosibacterium sp. sgz301328 TaxID=3243764 RepID=UPI00359E83DA